MFIWFRWQAEAGGGGGADSCFYNIEWLEQTAHLPFTDLPHWLAAKSITALINSNKSQCNRNYFKSNAYEMFNIGRYNPYLLLLGAYLLRQKMMKCFVS